MVPPVQKVTWKIKNGCVSGTCRIRKSEVSENEHESINKYFQTVFSVAKVDRKRCF